VVAIDIEHPRSMADPRAVSLKHSIIHDLGAITE
jgi:hypothetical protein